MHDKEFFNLKAIEEARKIHEVDNEYHNAIHEYLQKHGVDPWITLRIESKIRWLKFIAKKYGIELDERIWTEEL